MFNIPMALGPDYRYCRDIVHQNQENFPVGSWVVPRRIRPYIHAVYAFARTADDFADLPGRNDDERLRLLDDWERRLILAESGDPDHPIFRALAHTIQTTDMPTFLLVDLLAGFKQDVRQKRYTSFNDLLAYCRLSANPIGRIVLHLAREYTPETAQWSDFICTALQLANHLQDLGQDTWNGRPLYLPQEEMDRFGVTEKMILERRFSPAVGSLVLHLTEVTRSLFEQGYPLLHAVAWPINLELALIMEGGLTILDHIEEMGGNTLRNRPHIEPFHWLGCFWRAIRHVTA